ncbi:hypothetical protein ACFQ10_52275 [Streptomyces indonesiensis]
MNAEFLREHIDLLLNTPVELARAVVPPMVERGTAASWSPWAPPPRTLRPRPA